MLLCFHRGVSKHEGIRRNVKQYLGQICRNAETQNLESNANVGDDIVGGLSILCYDSSVAICNILQPFLLLEML